MSPVITDLKLQCGSSQRMGVFVDGHHAFDIDLLQAAALARGQELTAAEIEGFRCQDRNRRAYTRAIRFLAPRPRSCREVLDHLEVKGCETRAARAAVSRLVQEKILDDDDFARRWVDWRQQFRPRGRYALRHELRQKGVAEETIESALAGIDESASAWQAALPKIRSWGHLEPAKLKAKVIGLLQRRGFSPRVCYDVFERLRSRLNGSGKTAPPNTGNGYEEDNP